MTAKANIMPIINKIYCSSSQVVLVVRERPHAVNGGGFVVTNCSQKVVFKIEGCGVLGTKGELLVRDGDGDPLVLIRRKGGLAQALSTHRKWKGYAYNYEGFHKSVFSLKEPNSSCLVRSNATRISTETCSSSNKAWDFKIKGYFPDRDCSIVDSKGNIIAQIGMKKEIEELTANKDLYHIEVKPGIDQAFVVGIVATLDYIYGESTRCQSIPNIMNKEIN
ncbi:protein LURP-one-related 6-like [Mangifera indica]|uniref:protein LURP-one-related 6-like n=1 Tax=Mangifera indica TaxID=29780 RepID=UPI001CFA62AB|nr:protein LURP-one-related 6-like [Mangifera indica]